MDAQQQIQEKNIPLQDGKVDVDAWAESLGYRVENDQLMDGDLRAVAVSPGYGAGWSTWNGFSPLDPVVNLIILTLQDTSSRDEFKELYGFIQNPDAVRDVSVSMFGMKDVVIEWVHKDRQFRVEEYDGNEYIEYKDDQEWL